MQSRYRHSARAIPMRADRLQKLSTSFCCTQYWFYDRVLLSRRERNVWKGLMMGHKASEKKWTPKFYCGYFATEKIEQLPSTSRLDLNCQKRNAVNRQDDNQVLLLCLTDAPIAHKRQEKFRQSGDDIVAFFFFFFTWFGCKERLGWSGYERVACCFKL